MVTTERCIPLYKNGLLCRSIFKWLSVMRLLFLCEPHFTITNTQVLLQLQLRIQSELLLRKVRPKNIIEFFYKTVHHFVRKLSRSLILIAKQYCLIQIFWMWKISLLVWRFSSSGKQNRLSVGGGSCNEFSEWQPPINYYRDDPHWSHIQ